MKDIINARAALFRFLFLSGREGKGISLSLSLELYCSLFPRAFSRKHPRDSAPAAKWYVDEADEKKERDKTFFFFFLHSQFNASFSSPSFSTSSPLFLLSPLQQDPRSASSTLVSSQVPQDEQTRWLNDALAGVKRSAFFMGKAMVRRVFSMQLAGLSCFFLLLLFCFDSDTRKGEMFEAGARCPSYERNERESEQRER